jgi:hypothetical protein
MLEEGGSCTMFPEGIVLGSERKNAYFSRSPKVANINVLPNTSIELKVRSTECVGTLEVGGPSTLLLNEN